MSVGSMQTSLAFEREHGGNRLIKSESARKAFANYFRRPSAHASRSTPQSAISVDAAASPAVAGAGTRRADRPHARHRKRDGGERPPRGPDRAAAQRRPALRQEPGFAAKGSGAGARR